jgi:hypothetical protein
MDYSHRNPKKVRTSYLLGRGQSGGAPTAFLERTQSLLRTGLTAHMQQELLKGEQRAHQTFDGQGLDHLLLMQHVEALRLGIQVQDHALAHQLGGDILAFEVNAHHAVPIDFALQMQAIEFRKPGIRVDDLREVG